MTRLFEAKPFLIAEVGSNWSDLSQCKESIRVARECGADAAKFQAFDHDALYGSGDKESMQHRLPLDWLPELKAECRRQDIEFMCTAFSPEILEDVDPFVEVHKVASSDINYPQLLRVIARTGKPTLLSLGAATVYDVKLASEIMGKQAVFLSCVAAYPADCMSPRGGNGIAGISDHTLGYSVAVEAAAMGALVIEKHFTAFPELDTPDRPHSLTPTQFKRMVDLIRGREVVSEAEGMRLRHKRRLIATKDIAIGERLSYGDNFGAYRSLVDDTRGLSAFRWEEVQGKEAKVAVARGAAIGAEDFG